MSGIFAITAAGERVLLDAQRRGEVAFTVTNRSGCKLRARLLPRPQDGTASGWLVIDGEMERDLDADATVQIRVRVAVPAEVRSGSYAFRLDVVGVANPDEHVASGQWVSLLVPSMAPPPPTGFPWWILLIAALLAAGLGGGLAIGLHLALPAIIGGALAVGLLVLAVVLRARRTDPAAPAATKEPSNAVATLPSSASLASTAPPGLRVKVEMDAVAVPTPTTFIPTITGPDLRLSTVAIPTIAVPSAATLAVPGAQLSITPSIPSLPAVTVPSMPSMPTIAVPGVQLSITSPTIPSAPIAAAAVKTAGVLMPRLIGWQRADAVAAVQALGARLGAVVEQASASPAGTVLDHQPSDRQVLVPGAVVVLVVAVPSSVVPGGQP